MIIPIGIIVAFVSASLAVQGWILLTLLSLSTRITRIETRLGL